MTNSPAEKISVVAPIRPAIERVKNVLFRPFNFGKWVAIGFCSFLAGRTGSFHFNYSNRQKSFPTDSFEHAKEYVLQNLSWIIPVSAVVVVIFLALVFWLLWLGSRGKFMLLHCIVNNRGEISVPWKKFAQQALSLWKLQIILALLSMANLLMFAGVIVWSMVRFIHQKHHFNFTELIALLPMGIAYALAAIVIGIVSIFTVHFVVPIMFLRGGTWSQGWNEFANLLRAHTGKFVWYLLFQIVLNLTKIVLLLIAVLCTCCVAGVLMVIPYVNAVFLLPVTVFMQSYQLYYLKQYGADFDVFTAVVPPELVKSA